MKRVFTVGLLAVFLAATPGPATASPEIDWAAILRALGIALDSWRLSPFPRSTPTTVPESTATEPPATPTLTVTVPRPPTSSHTATRTRTPLPTSTPTPTSPEVGQIDLGAAPGDAPAQRLASAMLVFPYVVSEGDEDTRIELFNMSNHDVTLNCFYVRDDRDLGCFEVGFMVSLTAQQPLSWRASRGASNPLTFTAVPPFYGRGELKCAVQPKTPDLISHNTVQGRALVFDSLAGDTVGYGAVGFRRLIPGVFTGVVSLDGFTYEECPERLHFQVLSRQSGSTSDLVLVPCSQDLLTQTPTETTVQMRIINEFEQVFSSSLRFDCHTIRSFSRFGTLSKALLGTDTAHLVLRGVSDPLIGLVVERFQGPGMTSHTTANHPFLEGGAPAVVIFP